MFDLKILAYCIDLAYLQRSYRSLDFDGKEMSRKPTTERCSPLLIFVQ